MDKTVLIRSAREEFHRVLVSKGILSLDKSGIPSNADLANAMSIEIAKRIALDLGAQVGKKLAGQTAGTAFEVAVSGFVKATFPKLQHLRPGVWTVVSLGNRNAIKVSAFAQYEHLDYLNTLAKANRKLSTIIGNDYMVAPDVVVYRNLYTDEQLNAPEPIVADDICLKADLRKKNAGKPILHASISAKWTMRSDRAQNSRTEALNLIRNRKGALPHIVVVTGEPVPARIASLALGTGDIDCVYHVALYELQKAVTESGSQDAKETLASLIDGRRLKDISDLPLDLSV